MSARTAALVLERVLPATPQEVFAAWTTPERMAAWMSPAGAAEAEVDLRVGGAFRVVMVEHDRLEHTGSYLEVDPPRRLVSRGSRPTPASSRAWSPSSCTPTTMGPAWSSPTSACRRASSRVTATAGARCWSASPGS